MAEELAGTADPFEGPDPFGTQDETADTELDMGSTTAEDEGTPTESLIDPATLPEELKPHWSRMTRAYNKHLTELRSRERGLTDLEQKASIIDRMNSDPAYARQAVQQLATQLGLPIGAPEQAQKPAQGDVPGNVLQAAQAALSDSPDLQFLAPAIAKVAHTIVQQQVQPFKQQQEQAGQQRRQQDYEQMATSLSESMPGWEEHEDAMLERLNFLRNAISGNGPMVHPRYGSVLEMLYRWTTGEARATAEAGRRMQQALQSRTTTGSGTRGARPNVTDQIGKTSDDQEKWRIAFRDALAQAQNST